MPKLLQFDTSGGDFPIPEHIPRTAFLFVRALGQLDDPTCIAVLRATSDFHLESFALLTPSTTDPGELPERFWYGVELYSHARLVTFDGPRDDWPLLESAAFRFGLNFASYREVQDDPESQPIALAEWFRKQGSTGGMDTFRKLLGRPNWNAANRYDQCLAEALDTYFVFLRTRRMLGELEAKDEADRIESAKALLGSKLAAYPFLEGYLQGW